MGVIRSVVKNGKIELEAPNEWPEGTEVLIEPISPHAQSIGLREEDWPDTPAGIARHLALMDGIEPLIITPEEEAEWEAARKAQRDFEKARFEEKAETLRRGWE